MNGPASDRGWDGGGVWVEDTRQKKKNVQINYFKWINSEL